MNPGYCFKLCGNENDVITIIVTDIDGVSSNEKEFVYSKDTLIMMNLTDIKSFKDSIKIEPVKIEVKEPEKTEVKETKRAQDIEVSQSAEELQKLKISDSQKTPKVEPPKTQTTDSPYKIDLLKTFYQPQENPETIDQNSNLRKKVQDMIDTVTRDINIGLISFKSNAGKGSLLNTLFRSFYGIHNQNIAIKSNTKKVIRYSFERNGVNKNVFFYEYPVIGPKTNFDFKFLDLCVIVLPSDCYTDETKSTAVNLRLNDFSKVASSIRSITCITKKDLVEVRKLSPMGKNPFITLYSSNFHRFGETQIDKECLELFRKIMSEVINIFNESKMARTVANFYE